MVFTINVAPINIDATSGALKKATICKKSGKYYGKHKSHWHRAKKSGSRWYATGSPIKKPSNCKKLY